MALINKSTLHRAHSDSDLYSNLKEIVKYFNDPTRPPVVNVTYMTKDELNTAILWRKTIKKEYDPANGTLSFRDPLECITKIDNFYKFVIPKEGS